MNPLRGESTPLARALKTQSLPKCLPADSQALHTQTTATSMPDIPRRWAMLALKSRHCHENEWGATLEWREWGANGDYHLGVEKLQRCEWAMWRLLYGWEMRCWHCVMVDSVVSTCTCMHLCMWKWAHMCHSVRTSAVGVHLPPCLPLGPLCCFSAVWARSWSPELPQDSSCLCLTPPRKSIDACDTWSSFWLGSGDSNSGPHPCLASTFTQN